MVKYIKGDILKIVTNPGIILHSCNCYGSWGGGIAKLFASKYPDTYRAHRDYVSQFKPKELLGTTQVIYSQASNIFMVCIFTSIGGGSDHDPSLDILRHTDVALTHLRTLLEEPLNKMRDLMKNGKYDIYLPKINAGVFETPWEDTEKVLLKHQQIFNFIVACL